MRPIRSVLWIGSATSLNQSRVTEAPTLDLAWAPDVAGALELPLNCFDGVIFDAPNPETLEEDLGRLVGAPDLPPLLVHLPGGDGALARRVSEAGAREVVLADESKACPSALDLVERLERSSPSRNAGPPRLEGIIGESPAMREAFALVHRARHSEATVLLSGETGTGKELLGRAVHSGGRRRSGPFVAVNCAAFPDSLLESELFGHVKGAFTGAVRDRAGIFQQADRGTLFLDEVAELALDLQSKLLRVLEDRSVTPVGGSRSIPVDVRIVAATHQSLRRRVAAGHFREDLMFRLRVVPIFIPPLRERRRDVAALVWRFIGERNTTGPRVVDAVAPDAMRALLDHRWPGNVRELKNVVDYAFAVGRGPELRVDQLPPELREGPAEARSVDATETDEAVEIRAALSRCGGQIGRAAEQLGMSRPTLWRKRKKYGI